MDNKVLFVRMQNGQLHKDRLVQVFGHYGTVVRCHILEAQAYQTPKAFVEFTTASRANSAKESLNNTTVDGILVKVFWARRGPREGYNTLPAGVVKSRVPEDAYFQVRRHDTQRYI
jgi:hypothetical protein